MAAVNMDTPKLMWKPAEGVLTNMDEFRMKVNKKYDKNFESYEELRQWSIEEYADFWECFWEHSGIVCSHNYKEVIDINKTIGDIPEWFHGSRLNYAENLLKYDDEQAALYTAGENRQVCSITFHELRERVAVISSALRNAGVKKGDRVVGYIPNCSLAVEVMLATASLGAVWSSTSPDFGVAGVLDRFTQIKPKLIFSVDAVYYNNKIHDHLEKLSKVVHGLPELERVVVMPYVSESNKVDVSCVPKSEFLGDFLKLSDESPVLKFEQVPFSHPLFIMYSSGTTGPPKCMVHSVGGTLIQHLKEHMLHGNTHRHDVVFYYTTTGWMMWNWLVSALALGSSVVLYDGSPLVPTPAALWDLVDEVGITIFGTSARYIQAIEEKGVYPGNSHNLKTLHSILSTGSPLKPTSYDYVYSKIKKDLLLGSISGGTDIISCFVGQNTSIPVYRGEIQARNLGMAVYSWSDEGKEIYDQSGELVCTKPFPCMPTQFWNDVDGMKYKKAYFSKFPGVWSHGDYCQISSTTGGVLMLGRSDGTLNPSGVRFGSAEIYNIVENFIEVEDSVCIGQQMPDHGERVVLFLKMTHGLSFTEELSKKIKAEIRKQLSARHVPSIILPISDIPYTASGKKVEIAVKRIINGEDIKNRGALSNPDSLNNFYDIPQLKHS